MRFAVLGAGRIGQVHARAIASVEGAELAAVSDPIAQAAETLKDRFGCEVRTVDEVEESSGIDAVVICSPTDTHADLIERFARAGKAVFCEKPVDLNVQRVRACLDVVERCGTPPDGGLPAAIRPRFQGAEGSD